MHTGLVFGIMGGTVTWICHMIVWLRAARSPSGRHAVIKASVITGLAWLLLVFMPATLTLADVIPQWCYWISAAGFGACFFIIVVLLTRRLAALGEPTKKN